MANSKLFRGGVPICNDSFILKVKKNKLEAYIKPKEDKPGTGINLDMLFEEIKDNEIIYGVLAKPVPVGDGRFLIAKGKAAIKGENAKFKTHVKPAIVRAPKQRKPGSDKVDYRELGSIVNVPKDKLLIEKIPLTEGIKGKDVFGEDIAPKPGKDQNMKVGPGVELSEDEMKAISTLEGKFMLADGKASVLAEHTISGNVDMVCGNVAFVGERLAINGTVLPGFKIKCKHDIYVAKGVENASITAGRNIDIRGGVIGEDVLIRSWNDVMADFVENVGRIEVKGNLVITDSIIQAKAMVGKNLTVLGGKGTLIGGKYVVGGSVYVKELGSDAEVLTELTVGANPELEEKKKKLAADQAIWPEKMSEILKSTTSLKKMKQQQGANFPPEKEEKLKKLNAQLPIVMEKVNNITVREEQIEAEVAQTINECVLVYGTIFPGVSITIGPKTRIMNREERNLAIYFDKEEHKIKFRSMTSDEKAVAEAL